jgi:hypothetical protein
MASSCTARTLAHRRRFRDWAWGVLPQPKRHTGSCGPWRRDGLLPPPGCRCGKNELTQPVPGRRVLVVTSPASNFSFSGGIWRPSKTNLGRSTRGRDSITPTNPYATASATSEHPFTSTADCPRACGHLCATSSASSRPDGQRGSRLWSSRQPPSRPPWPPGSAARGYTAGRPSCPGRW